MTKRIEETTILDNFNDPLMVYTICNTLMMEATVRNKKTCMAFKREQVSQLRDLLNTYLDEPVNAPSHSNFTETEVKTLRRLAQRNGLRNEILELLRNKQ
jgi:hypothetical protein